MSIPEDKLAELGITLPEPVKPQGSYIPAVRTGNYVYCSGQVPIKDGELLATGTVGADVDMDVAIACARQCAINLIAALKGELGDLSSVVRIVKLGVFVASTPDFGKQPIVGNGASDLIAEVFGDAGIHARAAIGVASLPLNVPVEIELIAEVS